MDPYCKTLPSQLRAWDATTLRMLLECPRKLQLMQHEGWGTRDRVHLDFGSLYHEACEMFDKLRLNGVTQEAACAQTFSHFVRETAKEETLGTVYLPTWRCSSPAQVIGPRSGKLQRNAKRCRRAKELQFAGGHREGDCPNCGSSVVNDWTAISPNKDKNRDTLLRTILHYCDTADDRVRPYKFPDGTVAVELSFKLPLPLESPDGDPYLLCGNMDGMVEFAGEVVPRERKTTKNDISKSYFWNKYNPDVQIDTYDLAAAVLYGDLLDPKPHGVMVEVTRCTAQETQIERQIINIPEERRAEWLKEVQIWIKTAEGYARSNFWPKNTASCNANGGCPMRDICKLSPSTRERFLPGERYVKRAERWNPAQER
jgi:PD-(D/E)XK nuclease superfamily